MTDIKAIQADCALFQWELHVPVGARSRRFGDVMAPFQHERFERFNPCLLAVARGDTPPYAGIWDERTKGASKDSDWAVSLLWLLAFSRRALSIEIGACDQKQADEIRQIIDAILKIDAPLNRLVRSLIEVQKSKVVNTHTESTAEILTSDKMGSHGSRPDLVLLNELTHQADDGFASTLLDNADKIPHSLTVIVTNAGYLGSWQERWRQTYLSSPRWYVTQYTEPAPWIVAAALLESEKRNPPSRFLRLWRGIWGTAGGDNLPADIIDQAFHPDLAPLPTDFARRVEFDFIAGVDLGLTRDRAAAVLLGVHRRTKEIRLCQHHVWTPPQGGKISLINVEYLLRKWNANYSIKQVAYDPWQAALLAERLQRANIKTREITFTPANLREMASTVQECLQDGKVALYPNEQLRAELLNMRMVEKTYGVRVEFERTNSGHGDLGQAFCLALLPAVERAARGTVTVGALAPPCPVVDPLLTRPRLSDSQREYVLEDLRLGNRAGVAERMRGYNLFG